MTILSGQTIRRLSSPLEQHPLLDPFEEAATFAGTSHGLGPAGYDLRLVFDPDEPLFPEPAHGDARYRWLQRGEFLLVAAVEHFSMPDDLVGIVHDKSTWARRGLAVQNTIIEPGWSGFLTLELTNHGPESIKLVEGQGIAQVVFHRLDEPAERPYAGKYQGQAFGPQGARGE